MSFSIITINNEEETWYFNQPKPVVFCPIAKLWADGDELDFLKRRFDNLPIAHKHCVWKDTMAQFIYDNL